MTALKAFAYGSIFGILIFLAAVGLMLYVADMRLAFLPGRDIVHVRENVAGDLIPVPLPRPDPRP